MDLLGDFFFGPGHYVKRLIADNTGPGGSLNTDAVLRALLQYRNTPDPFTGLSPAEVVFGRQIRDFTPVLPAKYRPRDEWRRTLEKREEALSRRHYRDHERWSEHTRNLKPLKVGDNTTQQNGSTFVPQKVNKNSESFFDADFESGIKRGVSESVLAVSRFSRKFGVFCGFYEIK